MKYKRSVFQLRFFLYTFFQKTTFNLILNWQLIVAKCVALIVQLH